MMANRAWGWLFQRSTVGCLSQRSLVGTYPLVARTRKQLDVGSTMPRRYGHNCLYVLKIFSIHIGGYDHTCQVWSKQLSDLNWVQNKAMYGQFSEVTAIIGFVIDFLESGTPLLNFVTPHHYTIAKVAFTKMLNRNPETVSNLPELLG